MNDKPILDPCCGSKMFYLDKNNPLVLFGDIRSENHVLCDGRMLTINPDMLMDFRCLEFPDKSFKLAIFDPPHLNKLGKNSWMAKKYGVLLPTWEHDIKAGFEECFRVLDDYGVLVFKWNESQIKESQVLNLIPQRPLIHQRNGKGEKTIWMFFIKEPTPTP